MSAKVGAARDHAIILFSPDYFETAGDEQIGELVHFLVRKLEVRGKRTGIGFHEVLCALLETAARFAASPVVLHGRNAVADDFAEKVGENLTVRIKGCMDAEPPGDGSQTRPVQ